MAGVASLFFYIVVLVVSVTSVLFGLDWLSTPPPPHAKPPVHVAASTQAPSPQAQAPQAANATKSAPPVETVKQEAQAAPPASASPATGAADASAAPASPLGADTAAAPGTVGDAQADTTATIAPSAAAPRCNVHICTVAYRSFRASDCTWQPLDGGPRRQCTKGKPQARANQPNRADMTAAANQAQARACNVQACQQAYSSFDPADCTYQPYGGPRRYCAK